MKIDDKGYIEEVRRRIRACLEVGISDLTSVLQRCEGADPVTVARLLKTEISQVPPGAHHQAPARVLSAFDLPAPDPERSQWWFSTSGLRVVVGLLLQRHQLLGSDERILCLGCPSVAAVLAGQEERLTALDIDEDVVEMLRRRLPNAEIQTYDAAEELPDALVQSCVIAAVDPPWYDAAIVTFLNRALLAISVGGEVICTLPGRLTRPGIEESRAQLVAAITSAGHEILGIERGVVGYQVPSFESAALSRLGEFRGIPWRSGDLLHFRKKATQLLPSMKFESEPVEGFSRNPTQFRIFLRGTASADERIPAHLLQNYSQHISTRAYVGEKPDVWTSTKIGIEIGNFEMVQLLVSSWAKGLNKDDAIAELVRSGEKEPFSRVLAEALDEHVKLWDKHASPTQVRSPAEIEQARSNSFSSFATPPPCVREVAA